MKNNLQYEGGPRPESTGKLTDWKNEPKLMDLQSDLQIASPSRDTHVSRVEGWLNLRNVEGKAKPKVKDNRSQVQPKLIRRQNEWRYSALTEPFLSSETMFDVSPKTFEDMERSKQNSLVLEWQFTQYINKVAFIDQYVRTDVDEGSVIVRVGWTRETETVEVEEPIWQFIEAVDPEYAQVFQQAMEMSVQNYNEFLNLPEDLQEAVAYATEKQIPVPVRAVQSGVQIVEDEQVVKNHPTLDILHYKNFYLDPTCNGDLEKAKFGIITFETNKAELKKDGRYKNLEQVNWGANTPLNSPDHATNSDETAQFKDDLRRPVVAHEYWGLADIHGNDTLVPIVATWVGDVMIRMEENPFPDKKIPVVIVPYLPLKDSVHGETDAELLADNQAILGAVTRGMIDLMGRSANGQTGMAKGMLDVVNKRRYNAGQDYEYNPNIQPAVGIHQHQYPEIPQSALTMLQLQNQEAESLSGVQAFSGGMSGNAYGEVAAGIRGMLDAASKREMAILRRLAQGMAQIGLKMISMNQAFLTEEEVIRVTNEEFVTVRRDEIQGNYDLKVDISTAEVEDAQAKDLAFMLQTMGNNMDFNMVKLILAEIARLKRMPTLAKNIESFEPQPDPIEQQLKQMEIQKVQAEIQEIQSKIELNLAKAKEARSSADRKDLDFVETETGTAHEREMDKQGAQAEANIALEMTKAHLSKGEETTKSGP